MIRQPNAYQWRPPKRKDAADESFLFSRDVQSANECTGLVPQPPQDEHEAHALCGLYDIHALKPQGNIGKDNPRNEHAEKAFHRS